MERPHDLTVNNQNIWLMPYTEKRRDALAKVNGKIKEYVNKVSDMLFDDMPITDKAMFWKAKADILWHPVMPLSFYEDEAFEMEYLSETETKFTKDANESLGIAEEYFLTARNYSSDSAPSLKKSIWTNKLGTYKYSALMLANFNPVEADKIYDTRADQIAEAYVSKMCFEYTDPQTQKKRK